MYFKLLQKSTFIVFCGLILLNCGGIDSETFSADDIILLEVFDFEGENLIEEAPGDGETIIKLRAKIPRNSAFKTIKFESTNGTFILTGTKNQEGMIDIEGNSTVDLKLPLDNQPIFLTASVNNGTETFSSRKSITLSDVGKVLTLTLLDATGEEVSNSIRADGATIVKLKAEVNHNRNVFNQVTFTASSGNLLGNSLVNTDEENIAYLDFMVSQTVEKVFFTAEVGSSKKYFDNAELNPISSSPDFIIVEPTLVSMPLGSSNSIDIYLRKEEGLVSLNSGVSIRSYQILDDNSEMDVGRFIGLSSARSDENGLINVTYRTDTNDIDSSKPIFLEVSSENDDFEIISTTIQISIIS